MDNSWGIDTEVERIPILTTLSQALQLSAHILLKDSSQLTGQFYGRLSNHEDSNIQTILKRAAARKNEPWLRPLTLTLISPGGPLVRTLEGGSERINAVAFTPDGLRAVSAGEKSLEVWDLQKGTLLNSLIGHTGQIEAVKVTPDGGCAVSGSSDMTLMIWDLHNFTNLQRLKGHSKGINAVAITPDGSFAISGSGDQTVRVWDLENFTQVRVLQGHNAAVHDVAVTPDGLRVVSTSADKTLRIWDFKSGEQLEVLKANWPQFALTLSSDGRKAISGSDMVPIVWDLGAASQKEILTTFNGPLHDGYINAVAITPDDRWVISAGETMVFWDLNARYPLRSSTSQPAWDLHKKDVSSVVVSPDGNQALSASYDGSLKLWNLTTLEGEKSGKTNASHKAPIKWIGFGPKGEEIKLSVGYTPDDFGEDPEWESWLKLHDGEFHWFYRVNDITQSFDRRFLYVAVGNGINVIDLASNTHLEDGPFGSWSLISISPDGKLALCFSFLQNSLKLLDLKSNQEIAILKTNSLSVESLAITADGRWGIAGLKGGTLRAWDLADPMGEIKTAASFLGQVNQIIPTPNNDVLYCGDDGSLRRWNPQNEHIALILETDHKELIAVQIAENGQFLVVVSDRGAVNTFDLKTFDSHAALPPGTVSTRGVWKTGIRGKPVNTLSLFHHKPWLTSCRADMVTIWDLISGVKVASFTGDSAFESCGISPGDEFLVAGTSEGVAHKFAIEIGNSNENKY